MLKPVMETALNAQVNAEMFSSYLYLSMSAHFEAVNLPGAANWFRIQAQEELAHSMKFYGFILERGGKVTLTAIEAPQTVWETPLSAFEGALEHEGYISGRINDLVDLALQESDHATNNFLQWFVAEQVEEEASADAVVQRLRLVGNDGGGLFMVDQELSSRVFTAPA